MIKKGHFYRFYLIFIVIFLSVDVSRGAITLVSLNPAGPTNLSTGLGYYISGKTYNFSVRVIDPAITAWAQITDVRVTIPNSTNIIVALNPGGTGNRTADITTSNGPVDVTASIPGIDTYNDFTVTFAVTIRWDTAESNWQAARNIVASATTTGSMTDTSVVSYGICASTSVIGFSQSAEAADGMINPYYSVL